MILSGHRPRLLGAVVQVFDETDPQHSDTTLLVASLLTLGIPPAGREFVHITREYVRGETKWRTIWSLRDESDDQRFETSSMIINWTSGQWLLANPKHPLAILRNALTYHRALSYTPRFTLDELDRTENADTWLEAAIRNLIVLLRAMPEIAQTSRGIVRFGHEWAAMVPRCLAEAQKTRLLKYVEHRDKRAQMLAA